MFIRLEIETKIRNIVKFPIIEFWINEVFHHTTSNLNHFKVIEAIGLKVVASTSPAMASLAYKNLTKSNGSKVIREDTRMRAHTHRETEWWSDKPTFIFGKYAKRGCTKNVLARCMLFQMGMHFSLISTLYHSLNWGLWNYKPPLIWLSM
jgi:hypothetical protein